MSEIRVTRRLVKSPPELWAEVSDADVLARRLGELGEIRITRTEPETTVAWEGEHASGTVAIEGSGWGTAVTITARPATPPAVEEPVVEAPAPPVPSPDPAPPAPTPDPVQPAPTPDPVPPAPTPDPVPPAPGPEPGPPGPPEPGPQMQEPPAPPRGFLARLFGRRTAEVAESPVAPVPDPEPLPEPDAPPEPDPQPEPPPEPDPLPEPEEEPVPAAAPDQDPVPAAAAPEPVPAGPSADEVRGVLERVLDDLGAAHHRPFSRG
jgi:hypothetical protein